MRTAICLLAATRLASASCECGHTLNATSSGHFALFTNFTSTNFSDPDASITWTSQPGKDYQAQAYNVTPAAARGPFGKAFEIGNVVLNPVSNKVAVANGADPGLQLWVRSELLDLNSASGRLIPSAEVVSTRQDFLYGSFRAGMKTTSVNGTCGAFFFYQNNSQEIDIEVLSKQQTASQHVLNLVNQSPQSVASGYNAVNTSDFIQFYVPFNPTMLYTEYRFDWLPDRIDFYADSALLSSFHENIPTSPGALHLIHWSNGDPGWSGGPPQQDAVLTVSYLEAYFNTTSSTSAAGCSSNTLNANNACQIANGYAAQPTTSSRPPIPMHGGASSGTTITYVKWTVILGMSAMAGATLL